MSVDLENTGVKSSRVRASARDQFAGLKGRDYTQARGLKPFAFLSSQAKETACSTRPFNFLERRKDGDE